ncbi:MAG TPA: DUF433 domain-containing protein [Thermomicrobiales bacterium]
MAATLTTFALPLRLDEQGTIRVGRSRVTLDLVIDAYHRGVSPETIAQQFPVMSLAEIYGAITYYLQHQSEMNEYLNERAEAAAPLLHRLEAGANPVGLRAELQGRRAERQPGNGK